MRTKIKTLHKNKQSPRTITIGRDQKPRETINKELKVMGN
jgi:hypothetical protein